MHIKQRKKKKVDKERGGDGGKRKRRHILVILPLLYLSLALFLFKESWVMRNPCPPSTPRQNELQRRAKAHLALWPRKGDFKQHKASLGNCVVTNPIQFIFLSLTLTLTLCWCLYLLGGTLASGCNHNPTSSSFPSHKPHYY